jgi:hypothetical protein
MRIGAFGDRELFASASESNHVALFIVVGDRALCAQEVSANQNRMLLPERIDVTTGYHLGADRSVQFPPLLVCGAHYQDPLACLMGGEVFSGYLFAALFDVADLADVAATLKNRKRLRDFSSGGECHRFAELRIALAADGIEPRDQHSGLLHLIYGPSRFDRMMLPLVAHEDDPLDALLASLAEKPVNLPRGSRLDSSTIQTSFEASRADWLSRRLATVLAETPASESDLTARVVGANP